MGWISTRETRGEGIDCHAHLTDTYIRTQTHKQRDAHTHTHTHTHTHGGGQTDRGTQDKGKPWHMLCGLNSTFGLLCHRESVFNQCEQDPHCGGGGGGSRGQKIKRWHPTRPEELKDDSRAEQLGRSSYLETVFLFLPSCGSVLSTTCSNMAIVVRWRHSALCWPDTIYLFPVKSQPIDLRSVGDQSYWHHLRQLWSNLLSFIFYKQLFLQQLI